MIKNYFFLNRFVIESNKFLKNKTITDLFSQEKNKLLFELQDRDETIFLEISVHPAEPYINIRQTYSRAKKNTMNFFSPLIDAKINRIEIAEDDRIIRISTQRGNLYFTIRGKYTNVLYLSEEGELIGFKKIDGDYSALKDEFTSKAYTDQYNIPKISINSETDYLDNIRKQFPVISKEIIMEVRRRTDSVETSELRKTLVEVLNDIKDKMPVVLVNKLTSDIFLTVNTFGIFEHQVKHSFDDLISAQNFYLAQKYFIEEKTDKLKLIQHHIESELKKASGRINKLKGVIEAGNKQEEYRKIGNLLLINLNSVKPGMDKILIEDTYSPADKIQIKLDKKLSSKKNAELYFEKSKAERTNFQKSSELLKYSELKFDKLAKLEKKLSSIDDLKELKNIMKELKIKDKNQTKEKEDIKIKFKQYIIDNKFSLFVGRDSKNNDLLTTKFARQNDYWFHARGYSGSHVVLRVDNSKEVIPKNILKKAAAIAAFHSKAKTAGVVPVAYTFKKYVVKKKGDPTGTVHLLREDVLLVKPEVPDGCEYISSED